MLMLASFSSTDDSRILKRPELAMPPTLASNGQQEAAAHSKNILISQFPAVIPSYGRIFSAVH